MNATNRRFRYLAPLTLLFAWGYADAAPFVRLEVSAIVTTIDDPQNILGDDISIGDTLTGVSQYDLGLVDQIVDSSVGFYDGVPLTQNFIRGTNNASGFFDTSLFFDITVQNDVAGQDSIELFASGDTTPSTLAIDGINFVDLVVTLEDEQGTALANDSLPTAYDLMAFETRKVVLSGESASIFVYSVEATIDSITVTTVPEPGAFAGLMLLGSGLGFSRLRSGHRERATSFQV